LLDQVRDQDLNNLTPMKALELLQSWQQSLGDKGQNSGHE
jgi:hypothetical protein